jgi:EAL domain-containing protein (putative c-di-GMP-specific phosphodiesterase class I)
LDLEITETMIMEDVADNTTRIRALRDLGVEVAIDDFGTGYSSLAYLTRLPVNALKIDRAFIEAMVDEPDTMALVSTIVSLAHSLRLAVVAEGVETEEQAKILRLLRCDHAQGYLFGRPLPLEQLVTLARLPGPTAD